MHDVSFLNEDKYKKWHKLKRLLAYTVDACSMFGNYTDYNVLKIFADMFPIHLNTSSSTTQNVFEGETNVRLSLKGFCVNYSVYHVYYSNGMA